MKTQKIFFCFIALFCLAALSSCGKSGSKPAGGAVRQLEFMNWESSPEGSRFTNYLIKEFERENPNIRIKNNIVSGDYASKLLTRFAGNTPPDIFEIQAEMIHPFLRKGVLLDLTPYVKQSTKLNQDDFFPIALVNFRYDGTSFQKGDLFGFPKDFGTMALIYNKTLFDKEGLAYPNSSWTEKEYLETAQKLTKRDKGGRALQIGIDRPVDTLSLVLDYGGKIWSADRKKCLLDSPAAVRAYQFVYDLQEIHKVALSQKDLAAGAGEGFGFKSGKAAMSMVYRFELPDLTKYIGNRFQWGVSPLPSFNNRTTQIMYGPSGWSIAKDTKYPKDCFKFMEFLVGERGQIETARLGWNLPSSKKVALSDHFLKNMNRSDSQEINKIFLKPVDNYDLTLLNPYIPLNRFLTILNESLSPEVVKKYNGRVDIPLKMAVVRVDKEIEENLTKNTTH